MSSIEWTQKTWNPLAGCSLISPGCKNCYAMRMAARLERMGQSKYAGTTRPFVIGTAGGRPVWTGKITLDEIALLEPLSRKKPTVYFVNSMSDLFHEAVPDSFIDKVLAVIALCPQHTFQVLTKRAARMQAYVNSGKSYNLPNLREQKVREEALQVEAQRDAYTDRLFDWPLKNLWLGVSVEDQQRANERIPHLLQTPAAVRFLSCEPLLEAIEFLPSLMHVYRTQGQGKPAVLQPCVHWVIVGGESGPGARPFNLAWARSLRDQCKAAAVPFFFKQAGSNAFDADFKITGWNKKGNAFDAFPSDLQIRQMPAGFTAVAAK